MKILGARKRDQWLHPDLQAVGLLFHEHHLVLIEAKAREVAVVSPVEKLAARVWALG